METVANCIEHQLQGGSWDYSVPHATVYKRELKRFWPLNEEHPAAKIAQFAQKNGFRPSFYSKDCENRRSKLRKLTIMTVPLRDVLQPVTVML